MLVRQPFGNAANTARQQFDWLLSRESVLRLMLSFVLALALWLYVTSKQSQPVVYDYPNVLQVTYQGLNSNLIVNEDPSFVRVRFQLDNPNLLPSFASFRSYVDLAGLGPGLYTHIPVHIFTDPGIKIDKVTPAAVPLRIEQLRQVTVPVVAKIQRPPPGGYQAQVSLDPQTIHVTGPSSLVSQVDRAEVMLNLATSNFVGPYTPILVNRQGQPVQGHFASDSPSPSSVQVTVRVKAPATSKSLPIVVPDLLGQPRAGYGVVGLTAQPSQLVAQGAADILDRLTSISTQPISIAHRGAGSFTKRVGLRVPDGVSVTTRSVTVRVQLATVDVSTSISVGVTQLNVNGALVAAIRPASVVVTLVGPSSSVRNVAGRVHATLNLYGYGSGTFYLTPTLVAPPQYQIKGVYPQYVTVTLQPR